MHTSMISNQGWQMLHLESQGRITPSLMGVSPQVQKKASRPWTNQIGSSSSLQFVFQLIQPVIQFPEFLLGEGTVFLAILNFLLEVLDGFLYVFLCHWSLHRNFISSAIKHFFRSFVATAFLLSRGVNGLTLDTKPTTLHDPFF